MAMSGHILVPFAVPFVQGGCGYYSSLVVTYDWSAYAGAAGVALWTFCALDWHILEKSQRGRVHSE